MSNIIPIPQEYNLRIDRQAIDLLLWAQRNPEAASALVGGRRQTSTKQPSGTNTGQKAGSSTSPLGRRNRKGKHHERIRKNAGASDIQLGTREGDA
jgi:hypothetical protein